MKTAKLKKLAKKILTKYSDGHYTQFAGHENIIMAMKECAKEYHKQKIKEMMKELKRIRMELMDAVNCEDLLAARFQINNLDILLYKLHNELTQEEEQ